LAVDAKVVVASPGDVSKLWTFVVGVIPLYLIIRKVRKEKKKGSNLTDVTVIAVVVVTHGIRWQPMSFESHKD
jgi:hypothetical protein